MEGSPSIADKLARLAELENHFQQALEVEKLEAMAEFAAGAGHEINNPLTVISGRASCYCAKKPIPNAATPWRGSAPRRCGSTK